MFITYQYRSDPYNRVQECLNPANKELFINAATIGMWRVKQS